MALTKRRVIIGLFATALAVMGELRAALPQTAPLEGEAWKPATPAQVTRAKRDAQNLASVYSAGIAAGAELQVEDVADAIRQLRMGFSGTGAFENVEFKVAGMSDREAGLAAQLLELDDTATRLSYDPRRRVGAIDRARVELAANERLAITRAEAINMALASYVQAEGKTNALAKWEAAKTPESRYRRIAPFLAFAPAELDDYMPPGFSVAMPESLTSVGKVELRRGQRVIRY